MPAVSLHVPVPLREFTSGRATLDVEAGTVAEALDAVRTQCPALADRLLSDDGSVRPHVNLFLDGRDVRTLTSEERQITAAAELTIVPSIAGGRPLSREEKIRYHRQLILPGLGAAGQERLKAASALVVGAGGLGSPAALYLAAAGVGRIGLVDGDRVELSNLHRQILHDTNDVGASKTTSGRARLEALNPDVEIVEVPERLTSENARAVLEGWDVVLDGSDNFPTRYLVNDVCVLLGIPLVYGAIFRFDGQASVFGAPDGPCYRCLFRDPPPAGLVPSCAEAGVLGALPGIVGSIQATEAIKLITGLGEPLVGRLLLIDALGQEYRTVEVRRDPACPACGDAPTITEPIDYEAFCGVDEEGSAFDVPDDFHLPVPLPEVDARELREMIDAGWAGVLVDVREVEEHEVSNLDDLGAVAIPMDELEARLGDLDPERDSVWFCRTGRRSAEVVEFLHSRGFDRALNLAGGINGWARDVDPDLPVY
ncbi:MAG: molybdopterin-synthase adenylyltransferase MoeB [Gemmatimonadales bacterium]